MVPWDISKDSMNSFKDNWDISRLFSIYSMTPVTFNDRRNKRAEELKTALIDIWMWTDDVLVSDEAAENHQLTLSSLVYTVCDCTQLITQAENQIANHITCYYTLHVVAGNSQCVTAWAERCERNADNLLAVLPMKQRRCAKQYHLISPQCSSQACQPDSPQSLRIHTPGLLQPSDSFWSCYVPF